MKDSRIPPPSEPQTRPDVGAVVIGAGAAGLGVARSLEAAGISVRVLEQSRQVGASWWQRYDGLRLNTVRWLSDLPFSRMSRRYGRWPDREEWAAYLGRYASPLRDVVVGVAAQRIDRSPQGWSLRTDDGARMTAQHVVVATGHDRVPVIPNWPGKQRFTGNLMHSAQFRTPKDLSGKTVLVVGTGNSGVEIATLLAADPSTRVSISVRTPPLLLKRELGPLPITVLAEFSQILPDRAIDWLGRTLHRRMWADLAPYGLGETTKRLSMMRRTYYSPPLDSGFAAAVKRGAVEVVPAVTGFDDTRVMLDGVPSRPYDVVIAATGFRPGLEDLVGHLGVLDENGEPAHPTAGQGLDTAGLFFAGFRFGLFALLPYLEGDARAITKAIRPSAASGATLRRPLKLGPLAP